MSSFDETLEAAKLLSEQDRLRLIDALWDSVSPDSEAGFSAEWIAEINHRVVELDAGQAKTIPWSQIYDDALARLKDDRRT